MSDDEYTYDDDFYEINEEIVCSDEDIIKAVRNGKLMSLDSSCDKIIDNNIIYIIEELLQRKNPMILKSTNDFIELKYSLLSDESLINIFRMDKINVFLNEKLKEKIFSDIYRKLTSEEVINFILSKDLNNLYYQTILKNLINSSYQTRLYIYKNHKNLHYLIKEFLQNEYFKYSNLKYDCVNESDFDDYSNLILFDIHQSSKKLCFRRNDILRAWDLDPSELIDKQKIRYFDPNLTHRAYPLPLKHSDININGISSNAFINEHDANLIKNIRNIEFTRKHIQNALVYYEDINEDIINQINMLEGLLATTPDQDKEDLIIQISQLEQEKLTIKHEDIDVYTITPIFSSEMIFGKRKIKRKSNKRKIKRKSNKRKSNKRKSNKRKIKRKSNKKKK